MNPTAGLLALVAAHTLRDEVDRVGAAVGLRVVHLGDAVPNKKAWSAAVAVVLDADAAARLMSAGLPRRRHVAVLTDTEPTTVSWQAGVAVGAQRVLSLPAEANELVAELSEAADSVRGASHHGEVIAVIGARGGAGASVLATALAQRVGGSADALLVDLDTWGGGIDLLAGTENAAGLRWSDLPADSGRLTWPALRGALPRQRGVSVLSNSRHGGLVDGVGSGTLEAVVEAGRRAGITVVCDLPRAWAEPIETALNAADLVVVVSPCDVRSCAAGAAMAARVRAVNPNVGLVVRGPAPGGLRAAEVAEIVGLPLLAALRAEPGLAQRLEHEGLRLHRRSALATAAARVLDVLPRRKALVPCESR